MITKDSIDIACNSSRLQYATMHEYNSQNNSEIFSQGDKEKYLLVFDMTYIINMMERIAHVESDFVDRQLEDGLTLRLAYGILNSAAHYRHFFYKHLHSRSVLILFASDPTHYERYENTFKVMLGLVNMFKKTIFIERMDNVNNLTYMHLAFYTAMNIFNANAEFNKKVSRVVYVGKFQLASQMLKIDNKMIQISRGKIMHGLDIGYNSGSLRIESPTFIENRNTDLITTMLALVGFKHGFDRLESIKGKRTKQMYGTVVSNCTDCVDKDNNGMIVEGLGLSDFDLNLFNFRLRQLDSDFQNHLFILSKKLLTIWESKLKSNEIHSFNDIIELDDLSLKTNWLMET